MLITALALHAGWDNRKTPVFTGVFARRFSQMMLKKKRRDVTTPSRVDFAWVLLAYFAKPTRFVGKHNEVQNGHVRKVTLKTLFMIIELIENIFPIYLSQAVQIALAMKPNLEFMFCKTTL